MSVVVTCITNILCMWKLSDQFKRKSNKKTVATAQFKTLRKVYI